MKSKIKLKLKLRLKKGPPNSCFGMEGLDKLKSAQVVKRNQRDIRTEYYGFLNHLLKMIKQKIIL